MTKGFSLSQEEEEEEEEEEEKNSSHCDPSASLVIMSDDG